VAPLRPADDAVIIDTDNLDLDEVVDRILSEVRART
jgi:cytidylate kinase